MANVLILSMLGEGGIPSGLQEAGCSVVRLSMEESLAGCIDVLGKSLRSNPPTSLSEAQRTWLPRSADLADQLARRAASTGKALEWDEIPERFSQIIVVSERIVPIDLLPCRGSLLGTHCVISHFGAEAEPLLNLVTNLQGEELPLRRIAHVSTYYPGSTTLHEMDVVSATLTIDNRLAVEHYFYPTKEVAAGLFNRDDLDILHFECHGTATSLQVDSPHGKPVDVRGLYASNGPSVYFFLGCCAGERIDGVAPTFVRKGAKGALGAYCEFLSGGDSGEVSESAFYDALYQGLIGGKTLGEAVNAGRRAAAPGRIYYCAWLLFGNPNVRFSARRFGGLAPNPRLHRVLPAPVAR